MKQGRLIRSTGVIVMTTALSRVTGFVRDIIVATLFGTGAVAEVFIVAFRIPSLMRQIVAEGAAQPAFVPVLVKYRSGHDRAQFWELASLLGNVVVVALIVLTAACVFFCPFIVRAIAPGFAADPAKMLLAVQLTRVLSGYIFLVGLAAYLGSILNVFEDFFLPSIGPLLFNVSMIVTAVLFCRIIGVWGLVAGVLMGGVLQVVVQVPALLKRGFFFSRRVPFDHPVVRQIMRLLGPRVFGAATYQLAVFVDTILASFSRIVGQGAIAALYFANRLIQLPLGLFAVAVSTVVLPMLADHHVHRRDGEFSRTLSFSLETVLFLTLPAAVGLIVLARPIIGVLFERGAFDVYSTAITARVLSFYALGIVSFAWTKVLCAACFSLHDTKTPLITSLWALGVNIAGNLILMWPLKAAGLALATVISGTVQTGALLFILKRRMPSFDLRALAQAGARSLGAGAAMGGVLVMAKGTYAHVLTGPLPEAAGALLLVVVAGMGVFFAVSAALNIEQTKRITRWILRRR